MYEVLVSTEVEIADSVATLSETAAVSLPAVILEIAENCRPETKRP
jgi:hypothetical protein